MDETLPVLQDAKPLENYRIFVRYSDGVEGIVDLSEYVGKGVFRFWKEYSNFRKVAVGSSGELRWNDEIDLDGLGIYLKLTGKKPEDVLPKLRHPSHA